MAFIKREMLIVPPLLLLLLLVTRSNRPSTIRFNPGVYIYIHKRAHIASSSSGSVVCFTRTIAWTTVFPGFIILPGLIACDASFFLFLPRSTLAAGDNADLELVERVSSPVLWIFTEGLARARSFREFIAVVHMAMKKKSPDVYVVYTYLFSVESIRINSALSSD